MKLLFIDTETTGLDPARNAVIQVSGIIDIDGEEKDRFNLRVRPEAWKKIDKKAVEINGISDFSAYPLSKDSFSDFIKVLSQHVDRYDKQDKFTMVGQNPAFDYRFLSQWAHENGENYLHAFIRYSLIDLIAITALFQIAEVFKTENMKLKTIGEYLGYEFKAHDAMEDVEVTRKIFYQYADLVSGLTLKQGGSK